MTPFDDQNWTDGPTILPKAPLLQAITAGNDGSKRRLWRIPIVVPPALDGSKGRRLASIGVDENIAAASKIIVWLEDGALGVSLADRIRQYCPDGGPCKLWVAGHWGTDMPAIPGERVGKEAESAIPFSLRAILGLQAGKGLANETTTVKFRDE